MDSIFLIFRDSSFAVYLVSVVVSSGLLIVARRLAIAVSLCDKPTERKRHVGVVPLAGGLMVIASLLIQTVWLVPEAGSRPVVVLCVLLFLVGMFDDLHEIRVSTRLVVQVGVALGLVYWAGIKLVYLGVVFGPKVILFSGFLVPLLTCIGVIGIINAVNMIDGIDGLLGGTATVTLLAIALLASSSGQYAAELKLVLILAGACSAFLLFNISDFGLKRPVFMGDSGSLVIGFLIAAVLILLSQGPRRAFEPVVAGWLVGLPLLDTTSVMVRRVVSGHSPFRADRDHTHHVLMDCGFSSRATLLILVAIHAVMVATGLAAHYYAFLPAWLYFWLFVSITVAHFYGLPRLLSVVSGGRAAVRQSSYTNLSANNALPQAGELNGNHDDREPACAENSRDTGRRTTTTGTAKAQEELEVAD